MAPAPLSTSEIANREAAVRRHGWLAEPGHDLSVSAWVEIQNAKTENYLESLPQMDAFRTDVSRIINAEFRSIPVVRGEKSFDLRRGAGEQQASLWVSDSEGERCLVSASELDAISDAITEFAPSPDGSTVAWAMSSGGADWMIARFRDTATGQDNGDVLDGLKWPHFAWIDDQTVSYLSWGRPAAGQELTAINSDSSVRVHRLGTPQSEDAAIYRPEKTAWVLPSVSNDRKWLVVAESDGTVPARIYRQPTEGAAHDGWETVVDGRGHDEFIDVHDDETLVLSFVGSSAGRILGHRTGATPRVIHETRGETLDRVHLAGDKLVILANTLEGNVVQVLDLAEDALNELELPTNAVVHDVGVDSDNKVAFVDVEQIGGARRVVRYPLDASVEQDESIRAASPGDQPTADLHVSIVMATSADGTQIPMRVVRVAGDEPRGSAKVFLSVYGGYAVPYLTTSYESWHEAWLNAGGVLAYAGVRGGSEYGQDWHEAGIRHDKQRGIDDLIACVEWFEVNGWAEPRSVAINGMSNGGLMVSTVLTQRPELLGAAVPEVAVVDMLNFHKYTAAHGWIREYGDPENPNDRAMLAAYSPLHNISPDADYPPTLILTADKDDRVPPGPHSYKLAAELQDTRSGRETTYLRVAYDAGHATGRSVLEKVTERSSVLAFAANALRLHESFSLERMELTQ